MKALNQTKDRKLKSTKKNNIEYGELKSLMISSPESEKAALYCILFNKDLQKNINLLSEDDFYNLNHKEFFRYFKKTIEDGGVLDPILVPDKIRKDPQWFSVIDCLGLKVNFQRYINDLKEKSNQRKVALIAHRLRVKVLENCPSIEMKSFALDFLGDIKASTKKSMESEAIYSQFETEVINKDGYAGIKTGLPSFDELTRGFCRGTLNIIGGTPAVGKTTFVLNMANYMCRKLGKKVLFVSLEMDYVMLYTKLVSIISGIQANKMLSTKNNLSLLEWKEVMNAAAKISEYKFFFMGQDKTKTVDIENEVKILGGVDIIFIDYLQLLSPEGGKRNRYEEISQVSRDLKKMATRLNIPVVTVASINRSYLARLDKKPSISDLRDSGNIEYDADSIVFLYRESVFRDAKLTEDKEEFQHSGELILSKNRFGICNISVDLYWDGDRALFREIDRGENKNKKDR